MMGKLDERIVSLEERLTQLKAQQKQQVARRNALESRRSRKADTRRKILVGAIVLAKVDRGEFSEHQLREWLDAVLTRDDDRALFELGPQEPET